MTILQKEIYDLLPNDMPNVQAYEVSKKIEQLILNKKDELKQAISEIKQHFPSDDRVIRLAQIATEDILEPIPF